MSTFLEIQLMTLALGLSPYASAYEVVYLPGLWLDAEF
jgi:hypothetical protein